MTVFTQRFELGGSGLRVAVKDTIDVAGWPTQAGSEALRDAAPAEQHAAVVQAVLDQGCRLLGKTNTHELAYGMTGVNPAFGTPLNTHFPDFIPGGSSSGSAVAVASGEADFSIGTDTGGSIRLPAACCGVYGLKPTFGRLSREGVMPSPSSLDCTGPFAASAEMLIRAMEILDQDFKPLDTLPALTLGVVDVTASPAMISAQNALIVRSGLDAEHTQLPGMAEAFAAGMQIIAAETYRACHHLLASGKLAADVAQRLEAAGQVTPEQLQAAEAVRERFTAQVDAALERHRVLVLPTLPDAPMTLADALGGKIDLQLSALVRPFNLSGHPALSMPMDTGDQRPAGLQLVGRKGDDEVLCELARVLSAFIRNPE